MKQFKEYERDAGVPAEYPKRTTHKSGMADMYCKPIYTKHFAERFLERCNGDMVLLRGVKKAIQTKYCELVFECLVYGNPRVVSHAGYKSIVHFDDVQKKLVVKTIY